MAAVECKLVTPASKGFWDKLRLSYCWNKFLISSFFKRVKFEDVYVCFASFLLFNCCIVLWFDWFNRLVSALSGDLVSDFVLLIPLYGTVVVAGGVYCLLILFSRLNRLIVQYEAIV